MLGLLLIAPLTTHATDCGRLSARDCQEREARMLMAGYLDNARFVESLPVGSGRAEGVSGARTISRSLSGPPHIGGEVRIDRLVGRFRLELASTRDVLQYGRKAKVAGSVSVANGRLTIYSPVDVNFWQMAAVFMDRPVHDGSPPDGLQLSGWKQIDVDPAKPVRFEASLIAIGGDHFLLLHAPDGEASGVAFILDAD